MNDDRHNVQRLPGFEQVCVIEGMELGETPVAQFEAELGAMLGVRVQYLETIATLPDAGNRRDLLFAYHRDDYSPEFNAKRLLRAIRWFEDAISPRNNPNGLIYPERVTEYVFAAPPVSYPDHELLGSMHLTEVLVVRDTEPDPLQVTLNCASGRWWAWVRRDASRAVALLLVHEHHLERAKAPIDAFFGQHAMAVAEVVRASSAKPMSEMPNLAAVLSKVEAHNHELVRLAHRNEPHFVERWNRGPLTVAVHAAQAAGTVPVDRQAGAGRLAEAGFWATTTGPDGWCVVGVENDENLAVVVRVNLSGNYEHNFLVNAASAKLVQAAAVLPPPPTGIAARRYSIHERFAVGEQLEHPSFGLGRVIEVLPGNKLRALFDSGGKVLAHGR